MYIEILCDSQNFMNYNNEMLTLNTITKSQLYPSQTIFIAGSKTEVFNIKNFIRTLKSFWITKLERRLERREWTHLVDHLNFTLLIQNLMFLRSRLFEYTQENKRNTAEPRRCEEKVINSALVAANVEVEMLLV